MNGKRRLIVTVAVAAVVVGCGGGSRTQLASDVVPRQSPPADRPRVVENGESERVDADAARRRTEEEARAALARARATLAELIYFDFDVAVVTADAKMVLDRKLEILRTYPEFRVRIEGHCDERGSDEYNMGLGNRRAQAVAEYLASRGLSRTRLEVLSMGEERPLDRLHDERGWSKNRRAEFHIIAGPGSTGR